MQLFGSFHDASLRETLPRDFALRRREPVHASGSVNYGYGCYFNGSFATPPRCERSLQNVCERLSSD